MKKPTKRKPARSKLPASQRPGGATPKDKYVLRLFVAGATGRSHQAVLQVKELCETNLKGRVRLEVIDIYQQPGLASKHQIVATPTLIITLPLPVRRFIGSLTNITDLFSLMDLDAKGRMLL